MARNPFKKRAPDPHNCSLIEFAYARTGSMLKAARVNAYIAAWGVVRRELGQTPTVEEYADWWEESYATAYRHQALFREVFDQPTPDAILDALEARSAAPSDRLDWRVVAAA